MGWDPDGPGATAGETAALNDEIGRLREAIVMADNRLECALMGDDICRHCVELARSYLTQQITREGK